MGRSNINNKAVFLDRDGVINKNIYYKDSNEWESPRKTSDFYLLDGVVESLQELQENNYLLFIVTNQPSYAKGKTSLKSLQEIIELTDKTMKNNNINIIKTYCSFKHKDSIYKEFLTPCEYRKPKIGSLVDAKENYKIILENSWMIGDRDTDIECGLKAKTKTIKINNKQEKNNKYAFYNVKNLQEAKNKILAYSGKY